jgi:protein-S-isoprenylcysteine O-methyltransferase Ste14
MRLLWRLLLRLDNTILGLVLVPVAVSGWAHLWRAASQNWPFISAGFYGPPLLSLLTAAFSAVYISCTSFLLLTAGKPLAREETVLPNILAVAGAFSVYGFGFLTPASVPPAGAYVPLILLAPGAGLVLLSLIYLRRSFTVTPQAYALRQAGPYAVVRHPMYAGNILTVSGLGLLVGTAESFALALAIAGFQIGRAHFEERLLATAFPGYALYKAKVGAFLPRLR